MTFEDWGFQLHTINGIEAFRRHLVYTIGGLRYHVVLKSCGIFIVKWEVEK